MRTMTLAIEADSQARVSGEARHDDSAERLRLLVLGQFGPGLHLNHRQCQPLAVNGASEIACREQLRWDRMQILECAHRLVVRDRDERVNDDRHIER